HARGLGGVLPTHGPAGAQGARCRGTLCPGEFGAAVSLGPGTAGRTSWASVGGDSRGGGWQSECAALPTHRRRVQPASLGRSGRGNGDRQRPGAGDRLGTAQLPGGGPRGGAAVVRSAGLRSAAARQLASSLRSVPRLSRGGRLTGRGARAVPIAFRGYNWLTSRMEYLMTAATTASKGLNKGPIPVGKENQPVTVPDFLAAKARGVRLTMLTAYDYTMARLLDAAGVDGLLVGDSLGMVVQGHENSLSVTLEE